MPEVDSHTSGVGRRDGGVVLIPTRRATSNSYGAESRLATIHLRGMAVGRVENTYFIFLLLFFPITIRVTYPNSFKLRILLVLYTTQCIRQCLKGVKYGRCPKKKYVKYYF